MIRLSLLLLAAALLAGCGTGQRQDDVPVIVSAIGTKLQPGDPNGGPLDFPQRMMLGATAQGLVRFDAAGQIEPGLAERWIVIDDGRSYIFRLREATWPDGQPVTAAEIVRLLRSAARQGSDNPLAPFLAVIDEVVEMTPQIIEVRLKRPRPDLLKLFAQPELAIFRAKSLEGSGPFRATASTRDWLLQPVEDAELGTPAPERTVRMLSERAALALARFQARKSDLVLGGSFADWPIVRQAGIAPANIRLDPAAGLFGLAITKREGFLADPANRAAIAMAIDRGAIAAAILPDWTPVETIFPDKLDSAAPQTSPGWAALAPEARLLAARARVRAWQQSGGDRPVLRLAVPQGPGATLLWGHVAASMRRIGIELQRVAVDDRNADLRLIDAVAPYDSGRWYLHTACAPCDPNVAALITAAREAPDLATRAQRIAEADAALTADAAFIPLAQPLRWSVVAMRLGAWQRNTRAWHPLNHLRNEAE